MRSLKDTLKNRLDIVTRPTPTVVIHRGEEFYVSDNGEQETKRSTYVKFSVKFRDSQLAQLKGATLAIFICLALHIEEDGTCFPSVNLICKETGYNRDTVFDALSKLEFRGYIARKQKTDRTTKKFRSNVYQLFPKALKYEAKTE
jgi:DNA-binding MarR family transcriptional regulator